VKKLTSLIIITTLGFTLMVGCIKTPDAIKPKAVDESSLKGRSCEQIHTESVRVIARLSEIEKKQDKLAAIDRIATPIAIFFPDVLSFPAFLVGAGADIAEVPNEDEIATLKGEIEALDRVAREKECGDALTVIVQWKMEKEMKRIELEKFEETFKDHD